MAVMVVCAMHYPSRIIYIFGVIPVPIWFFVLFGVAKDWMEFASHAATGTAVSGHLGGAAFGFIYYRLNWRISGLFSGFKTLQRPKSRSRLRLYREVEEPVVVNPSSGHDSNELLEAKLDAILEKVARSGQASLSESERQILLRASEVYKRKKT